MSSSFSNLPALHLPIARSNIQARLWWLLTAFTCIAVAILFLRGHFSLAVISGAFFVHTLRALRREAASGMAIKWQDSMLAAGTVGNEQPQRLVYANTVLPWAVYLELQPLSAGGKVGLWVFKDSLCAQDFRRLRVRANIVQHGALGY